MAFNPLRYLRERLYGRKDLGAGRVDAALGRLTRETSELRSETREIASAPDALGFLIHNIRQTQQHKIIGEEGHDGR